jgi:hypothetical protein
MIKKYVGFFLACVMFFACCSGRAAAQSKIIKKTVTKVVAPQIAPAQPPTTEPTPESAGEVPPLPPLPPDYNLKVKEEDRGIFGWGWNADAGAKLLFGSILLAGRGDLVFSDPLLLGEKIGLAEDAVEYKLGTVLVISDKIKSIPLFADSVVYLKEGSFFGQDPYIGAGLILNILGSGSVMGGLGGQIYGGVLSDFGFKSGKTGITVGYASYKVGSALSDSGCFISICQPLKL